MRSASIFFAALFTVLTVFQSSAFEQADFPQGPELSMTPGSLCKNADKYRYPEHIAYCERDVESQTKRSIIREYDQKFGYRVGSMDRGQFKIDHYIPLCAGGSNERSNLWPQHRTVYEITDPLEQEVCEAMAAGKLSQSKAVELIKEAKGNLDQVDRIRGEVGSL